MKVKNAYVTFESIAGDLDPESLEWRIDQDFEGDTNEENIQILSEKSLKNISTKRLELLFETFPYLQTLSAMLFMTIEYVPVLVKYIKTNYQLQELYLNLSWMGEDGTKQILTALQGHPSLQTLMIGYLYNTEAYWCEIEPPESCFRLITEIVKQNFRLDRLHLTMYINNERRAVLDTLVRELKTLESFSIMGGQEGNFIASGILNTEYIQQLDLKMANLLRKRVLILSLRFPKEIAERIVWFAIVKEIGIDARIVAIILTDKKYLGLQKSKMPYSAKNVVQICRILHHKDLSK
jgi:hypothetical protein